MASLRVLVADDDRSVRRSLERALIMEGYEVEAVVDGVEAAAAASRADLVLLDVTMPNMNGFDVCRQLRGKGLDVPILMLTARHSTSDRVEGLDAGADDYLVKPFALEELLARVRALLRRHRSTESEGQADVVTFADVELDRSAHQVRRAGRPLELTRTEFALLELFLEHPEQVLTRDQIYSAVWGYDASLASNSLEVYIGYLRRKTEADGRPRLIHTVRGIGYVVRDP